MANNDRYKIVYGDWVGGPKGVKADHTKCCQTVWHGFISSQCSRKRGHGLDSAYCSQHAKQIKDQY